MERLRNRPLSEILRTEKIYNLFFEEFSKEEWLDVTVLLHSDCSVNDILEDGIDIPQKELTTDYEEIIEIDVKDIPKEVEKIQFIISY